jgi:hypothetical protein
MTEVGPNWQRALAAPRIRSSLLESKSIPTSSGVYIWLRDGEPIYIGEAKGKRGLRQRLGNHRSKRADFSSSTLRASVAVAQLGMTRHHARQRPSLITGADAEVVTRWLSECEVAWIECASAGEAHALEAALRTEWLPPLNRM